ncbi:MAG: hypothetical protein COA79_14050 [Planctomycetota bacterium]|nr:MAG: hypothetical protein COA79_14050 [Planctomycetota bacterium]
MKSALPFIGLFLLLLICGLGLWLVMAEPDEINSSNDPFSEKSSTKTIKKESGVSGISKTIDDRGIAGNAIKTKSNAKKSSSKSENLTLSIDQSLGDGSIEEEGRKISKVEQKKLAQLQLQLFDAITRKPLNSIEVTLQYKFYGKGEMKDISSLDEKGNANFSISSVGTVQIYVVTNEFALYSKQVYISEGDNQQKVYLYKGGTLEVHAFDKNKKYIEDISVLVRGNLRNRWRRTSTLNPYVTIFDEKKGLHIIKNVPIGSGDIAFSAAGFKNSPYYKISVEKDSVVSLSVQFLENPIVSFRLINAQEKIGKISVTPQGQSRARGFNNLSGYRGRRGRRSFRSFDNTHQSPTEINVNNEGLFEYELLDKNTQQLEVYVEGYLPNRVTLVKDKTSYDISLEKGHAGVVKVVDKDNKILSNVRVTYTINKFKSFKDSDGNGTVKISGLNKNEKVNLSLSHANHLKKTFSWEFDYVNQNSTTVQMEDGKSISGKIFFGKAEVADARIQLFKDSSRYPHKTIRSSHDGTFNFGALEASSYSIKAYHGDYGVGASKSINFEKDKNAVDLFLVEEKSIQLKFVTNDDVVIPDFEVVLTSYMDPSYIVNCKSNEEGYCEVKNVVHGRYSIRTADPLKSIKSWRITVPTEKVLTLKVVDKDLKKLLITDSSGQIYNGPINLSMEIRRSTWPIDIVTNDNGEKFISLRNHRYMRDFSLLFESDGFALTRLGPYRKSSKIPDVVKVVLQEGENYRITVVNEKNDAPVAYTPVEIWQGRMKLQSLPTDQDGVVKFVHLASKFDIKVYAGGFAEYKHKFDGSVEKEFIVKLMRGGTLKGVYPMDEELSSARGYLRPSNKRVKIDADGNFEIGALKPGEYELSISRSLKNGKTETEKIPTKIIIVNEEIFYLDLNNFRKNQTTLDVRILKDGAAINERGFLRINDRSGKMVIGVNVNNGKHVVEHIYPGEYVLSFYYKGKELKRKITLTLDQENAIVVKVPQAILEVSVVDESGKPINKVLATLYPGEKYKIKETYMGQGRVTRGGKTTFSLMPDAPYYVIVEEDFRSNYLPQTYGPFTLSSSESKKVTITLSIARQLSKIKIVDEHNKPLKNVAFYFLDSNNNIFQRRDWKSADLFPYSNKKGFLPKNSWPHSTFQLFVNKEGYESKSVQILNTVSKNELIKIKLLKAASINIKIIDKFQLPISVGLLGADGKLLDLPTPLSFRKARKISTYIQNVSSGSVKFNNLGQGTYYIGYYWNGSTNLISKQGPISIRPAENASVNSNFIMP